MEERSPEAVLGPWGRGSKEPVEGAARSLGVGEGVPSLSRTRFPVADGAAHPWPLGLASPVTSVRCEWEGSRITGVTLFPEKPVQTRTCPF